tara:strand:- start:2119 stop:2361 length:243 start_codon:yes stop_codon:yes gene_type:complete
MQIHLEFYGEIAELLNKNTETISIEADNCSLDELKNKLFSGSQKLQDIQVKIAINNSLATPLSKLKNNDKVSFLPPFAGG